jgi:Coenzyme Q (ubiquinone) biosynthesis protein Coq4
MEPMNFFQKGARQLIKKSFHGAVWLIEQFHDMEPSQRKVHEFALLPDGTLGKEVSNCLILNHLCLVPRYESHDLKHILLDFKMTPENEIRMQAFMLGNGNGTVPCLAILVYGLLLLPDQWRLLWSDFKRGQKCHPISDWTLEAFADQNVIELRKRMVKEMK